MQNEDVQLPDRILAAATNVTGGTIGVLWLIFCAITRRTMSKFLMFNIYQSAFLALFFYLAGILLIFIYNILIMVPFINIVVNAIYLSLFTPVYFHLSIMSMLIFIIYVYLFVCAMFGVYGKLPYISKIILYQLERF